MLGPSDRLELEAPAREVVAEIEIAIVIGQTARNVSQDAALDYIAGYTIANDVSARSLNLPPAGRRDRALDGFLDWLNGKWLDGYLVMGPTIVTAEEWHDDGQVSLSTRISGITTVQGSTGDMLFSFEEIVSFASHLMTLRPGDVILTGMPETPKPERHLVPGDVIEGEVFGLGILRTEVTGSESWLPS